ncbi:MAG: hypothetical protein M3548_00755, partial [Actinomycetota bacterium]|nr:hypothetical protein [Actinomycetota bacterium]
AVDVLVHCTTAGLAPDSDQLVELPPLADAVQKGTSVVDLVYTPARPTPLVAFARASGALVTDGLEVLVRQGALSLERWTGRTAPLEAMRVAVRGAAAQPRGCARPSDDLT